jgi:hypothetical protein
MEAAEEDDLDHRRLPRDCSCRRGCEILEMMLAPTRTSTLTIDASETVVLDAYGGVSIRIAIEAHLARDPANDVRIIVPEFEACHGRLHSLLALMPGRCSYVELHQTPPRDREIVVPTMLATDDDRELIEQAIRRAVPGLGFPIAAQRALLLATRRFTDNARTHGAGAPVSAVAALVFEPSWNELCLVVSDLGPNVPTAGNGAAALEDAVALSEARLFGNLDQLAHEAADPQAVSETRVWLAHGDGRARFRDGNWSYWTGPTVPGFVAGFAARLVD